MKSKIAVIGFIVAGVFVAGTVLLMKFGPQETEPDERPSHDYVAEWEEWCATQGGVVVRELPSDSCQVNGEAISYSGVWPSGWVPPDWR